MEKDCVDSKHVTAIDLSFVTDMPQACVIIQASPYFRTEGEFFTTRDRHFPLPLIIPLFGA